MKWKIVGEVKLGPNAKADNPKTPTPPENIIQVCNSHYCVNGINGRSSEQSASAYTALILPPLQFFISYRHPNFHFLRGPFPTKTWIDSITRVPTYWGVWSWFWTLSAHWRTLANTLYFQLLASLVCTSKCHSLRFLGFFSSEYKLFYFSRKLLCYFQSHVHIKVEVLHCYMVPTIYLQGEHSLLCWSLFEKRHRNTYCHITVKYNDFSNF